MCFRRLHVSVSLQERNIKPKYPPPPREQRRSLLSDQRDPTSVSVAATQGLCKRGKMGVGRRVPPSLAKLAWSLRTASPFFSAWDLGLYILKLCSLSVQMKPGHGRGSGLRCCRRAVADANAVSSGSRCWTRPCWSAELQKTRGLLHY